MDSFLPVTGIPTSDFNNLYGTYDGTVLHATRWYGGDSRTPGIFVPDEYSSHSYSSPPQTVDICEYQPGRSSLTGERVSPSEPSALAPGADALLPVPPGPATPPIITDEDRGRAAAAVATDLQNADGTSASATMAKATFEQVEALWPVDWDDVM